MKRITIIALMSLMFLGQSYAQNKQKAQSVKTVVMEQISPAAYTTFKVSNNVTMYKVSFQNQYKMNVAGHLFIPKSLDTNR